MSAIAGLWRYDGSGGARAMAERIAAGLAAYGPHRSGLWDEPGVGLALGWRQFAILPEDSADRQPLRAVDGAHVLVADCRIDNRDELAGQLDLSGEERRGLPDSAIILAAYRRWGRDCVQHLVGDFAFALLDRQDGSLFLARDPLGVRPLFWARGAGTRPLVMRWFPQRLERSMQRACMMPG